jgi:hypothetical protein
VSVRPLFLRGGGRGFGLGRYVLFVAVGAAVGFLVREFLRAVGF